MKILASILAVAAFACCLYSYFGNLDVASTAAATQSETAKKKNLPNFRSEAELESLFRKLKKNVRPVGGGGGGGGKEVVNEAMAMTVEVSSGPEPSGESVTNVQHAGVDEGGIVKLHDEHLIILRRGRLFTVSIKNGALRPVSSIDAYGPGLDPKEAWYDEMLISRNTIVVVGYSYDRTGTEIGLFNIDDEGRLKYRSTYHLRSSDYYSSRNYASRLIGQKLIFYSPLHLSLHAGTVSDSLPAIRRWRKGVTDDDFKRIAPASRIYRGQQEFESDPADLTFHTVTTCDLSGDGMACEATSVLGPSGNVFYVSAGSVYVWTSPWLRDSTQPTLFRMPLDGSAPSALKVSGSPTDQFSFLETSEGDLNVLVRSDSKGDGMWAAETSEGDVALMQVRLTDFSDGETQVAASQYRQLPKPDGYAFQNRFVGDYVLYGTGSGWYSANSNVKSPLYVAKWNRGDGIWSLPLQHGTDRIEQLGSDAIVVGADTQNLHFTSIRLTGEPTIVDRYTMKNGSQGELRSHGFFYKPDGDNSGVLGLPVRGPGRPGYEHLFEDSASILFLRNRSLNLKPIGDLRPNPEGSLDDRCRASCVDWYGNARPLFIRGRVFALLGYEIVEGRMDGEAINEVRRANFAPTGSH
jgi:hypothetical protein